MKAKDVSEDGGLSQGVDKTVFEVVEKWEES